jgi:hypothetical protein
MKIIKLRGGRLFSKTYSITSKKILDLEDLSYEMVRDDIITFLAEGDKEKNIYPLREWCDAISQILHHTPMEWDSDSLGAIGGWGLKEWECAFSQYEKMMNPKFCYSNLKSYLRSLRNKETKIYRALGIVENYKNFLSDLKQLKKIGIYWAIQRDYARPIWSHPITNSTNLYFIVARGIIKSLNIINLNETFLVNVIWDCSEREIRLKEGSRIELDQLSIYRIDYGLQTDEGYRILKDTLIETLDLKKKVVVGYESES